MNQPDPKNGRNGWIVAMHGELNKFQRNDVWDLVVKPAQKNIIETKWVFKNKLNELVAQSYRQQEAIDYTEIFSLVARLEAIKLLLSYVVAGVNPQVHDLPM